MQTIASYACFETAETKSSYLQKQGSTLDYDGNANTIPLSDVKKAVDDSKDDNEKVTLALKPMNAKDKLGRPKYFFHIEQAVSEEELPMM